jgi:predicted transposase/invertase (TIGR01784 family)
MFAGQIEVSDQYYKLKRTISINILDFRLFNDDRCWRKGHITDDITNENMSELLEIQFIELGKLRQVEKESPITFWIEFFRNPYSESVKALCDYVPEIKEAKQIYEKAKSDPKARALIEAREKAIRDYSNDIACAKEEGREEGEQKKAREMAKNLLLANVDVNTIANASGLSIDEIRSL